MKRAVLILWFWATMSHAYAQSWQRVNIDSGFVSSHRIVDAKFVGDTGIAIGYNGVIYSTDDFFSHYAIDITYEGSTLKAISSSKENGTWYISANGVYGGMLVSVNRGNTWSTMANSAMPSNNLGEIFMFINGDTALATHTFYRQFVYSYNKGQVWYTQNITEPFCQYIYDIAFTSDSIGFMLCSDDPLTTPSNGSLQLFRTTDYANNWQYYHEFNNEIGFGDFYILNDSTYFLISNHLVLKSVDRGINFYPVLESPDETDRYEESFIHTMSFSSTDTGYMAFPRSVFKTIDAGEHWYKTDFAFDPNDINNNIRFIYTVSGDKALVGCNNGNIFKTTTGGGVWTSVESVEPFNNILIYPNPATSKLVCTLSARPQQAHYLVMSVDGKQVINNTAVSQSHFEVDVSQLASGVYYMVLQDNKQYIVKRFIKH